MLPPRNPVPVRKEKFELDTKHTILDLIHEETKRPHPTGEIALNAKLVKLEYLFQELNKIGEEKKAAGIICQHTDERVFEKLFGNDKHTRVTTYYPILIQELIESGIGRVEFKEGHNYADLFNQLMAHPLLINHSINCCKTSTVMGTVARKCVLFDVEFVLIMKENSK